MDPALVPISALREGDYFEGSPLDPPDRTNVFRVTVRRAKTVLADSVAGLRLCFARRHLVRRATEELYRKLEASTPVKRDPTVSSLEPLEVAAPTPVLRRGRVRKGRVA